MQVHGVDTNEHVVRTVASGTIHISEPDLDGLVSKVVSSGALTTSTRPQPADVFMIAVPTPVSADNRPDLSMVRAAVDSITDVLEPGNLVILESTSPIGTTEGVAIQITERRPDLHVGANGRDARGKPNGNGHANGNGADEIPNATINVAYCPERVLPGRILTELINNDRCIGGVTPACTRRAQRFYKNFVRGACVATTARAAELVKLTENAFRDTNIAFANELSMICDRFNINVWEVIDLANRHPRVNVLRPGPGVGGHCIAVDPWFIIDSAPDITRLMRTSREVNNDKTRKVIERAEALIEERPYANVACCGLTFKANIDDLRESPAMEVVHHLAAKYGSRIKVVEPNLRRPLTELAELGVEFMDIDTALRRCEIALLLVDHDEFKIVPLADRRHLDVIDTRGVWQDLPARA
jgi:UDP-N-acetyl-D-mannosaminuronic acid dehydrogenase